MLIFVSAYGTCLPECRDRLIVGTRWHIAFIAVIGQLTRVLPSSEPWRWWTHMCLTLTLRLGPSILSPPHLCRYKLPDAAAEDDIQRLRASGSYSLAGSYVTHYCALGNQHYRCPQVQAARCICGCLCA
jgi:hypothetical protein